MIPAVIIQTHTNRYRVDNLVRYCRELDGTNLQVLPLSEEDNLYGLIRSIGPTPFMLMTPGTIPVAPGWLNRLHSEWVSSKKDFLLTSDTNSPHDITGVPGIYGARILNLVPNGILQKPGWDRWIVENLPTLICRSSFLQHSYGKYDLHGGMRPHRFPQEIDLIRENALVFHRDPYQDLLPRDLNSISVYHTGDIGDIIAALPTIRSLGKCDLIIGDHTHSGGVPMRGEKYDSLLPLLEVQPFLKSIRFEHNPEKVTYDLSSFREIHHHTKTLLRSQAEWLGAYPEETPWLQGISPSPISQGKIVVARSSRWHNYSFPWRNLVAQYKDRMIFVGLPGEYQDFCQYTLSRVQYHRTTNFLQIANLIAGSDLFIGNQSSPCWIALGLGHPLIQETHEWIHDSIIRRDNAQYFEDGKPLSLRLS